MQEPKLNLNLLSNLLKDNKKAIKHALELFVETTLEDMSRLNKKIEEQKFLEAARLTHSLKSRFVYLGNDDASEKVRTLESMLKEGKDGTRSEIRNLFDKLNSLINYCINQIHEEIKVLES